MIVYLVGGILFAALISVPAWLLLARAIPQGPPSLLKAWGIGFAIKMVLAGLGIWAVIRVLEIPLQPFVWAFLSGYVLALILEIWWATRRIRRVYSEQKS
ncbi:MAG: hypothetical protein V1784_10675 [bacterium]